MNVKKEDKQVVQQRFATIRKRQILAISISLILILIIAAVSKRPDLFGAVSKKDLLILMVLVILGFVNFSAYNWRCPSCKQYLGSDLGREICRKCGSKLR